MCIECVEVNFWYWISRVSSEVGFTCKGNQGRKQEAGTAVVSIDSHLTTVTQILCHFLKWRTLLDEELKSASLSTTQS